MELRDDPANRFDHIGWALRMLRERRGMTQMDVAIKAGLGRSRLSGWETGAQFPTLPNLGRLAAAIGFDMAELDHALAIVQKRTTRPLPPLPVGAGDPAAATSPPSLPAPTAEDLAAWLLGTTGRLPSTAEMVMLPLVEGLLGLARHLRAEEGLRSQAVGENEDLPTF